MKKVILITAALTTFISSASFAADFETTYMQKYAEVYQRLMPNAGIFWPGFEVNYKHPEMIFFEKSNHTYALDFTTNNPAWKIETINNYPVKFLAQDSIGISKFVPSFELPYFKVEGQQTIVYVPFDFSETANADRFVTDNILFSIGNNYQYYEFLDSPYAKSKLALMPLMHTSFSGYRQLDNMSYLYLESKIIEEYLTTFNADLLKDFAAVESTRAPTVDANSALFEKGNAPIVENYVAMRAFAVDDATYAKVALGFTPYLGNDIPYFRDDDYNSTLAFIGSGVDIGLDKIGANWKNSVEAQNISPTVLLQQFFHLNNDEIASRLTAAKAKYNYADIQKTLSDILTPYNADLLKTQQAYAADKGIVFQINLASSVHWEGEWSSNSSNYYIDSNHVLEPGVIKINVESPTQGFKMLGTNMPIINEQSTWNNIKDLTESYAVKLAPTTVVTIDGAPEPLNQIIAEAKNITAKQIEVVNGNSTINITSNDLLMQLEVKDGSVQISVSDPQMKKSNANLFGYKRRQRINLF